MLKVVLVVAVIAVAIYVTIRLFERRGGNPRPPAPPEPRPYGPDDDPDFLREIDKRKKHPEDPDASG